MFTKTKHNEYIRNRSNCIGSSRWNYLLPYEIRKISDAVEEKVEEVKVVVKKTAAKAKKVAAVAEKVVKEVTKKPATKKAASKKAAK